MPATAAEHLFEPGHTAGTGTGAGSGLGLALARRIARSTGGDVALVEDADGEHGATFAITLPAG